MTFLNPLLLIGLVAAAIPIIIHLLNLRKLKIVEFSSLQFLKELQKTKIPSEVAGSASASVSSSWMKKPRS